jgi:DNA polymerase-1
VWDAFQDISTHSEQWDGEKLVRTKHYQTHSENGRLCMDEPNLQQIPRQCTLRVSTERNGVAPRATLIARPGNVLLSADYKHLELRIAAHFSGDENLLNVFRRGGDPFKIIAAKWLNINEGTIKNIFRLFVAA